MSRVILDRASSEPTITSSRDSPRLEQGGALTHVLNNIQNVRRFCYRAGPVQGPQQHRGRSPDEHRSSCARWASSSCAAAAASGEPCVCPCSGVELTHSLIFLLTEGSAGLCSLDKRICAAFVCQQGASQRRSTTITSSSWSRCRNSCRARATEVQRGWTSCSQLRWAPAQVALVSQPG